MIKNKSFISREQSVSLSISLKLKTFWQRGQYCSDLVTTDSIQNWEIFAQQPNLGQVKILDF